MKEQYSWNYNIKIKTKEGTYEYEDKLENIEKLMNEHREEGDMQVNAEKVKVKKRNIISFLQPMAIKKVSLLISSWFINT